MSVAQKTPHGAILLAILCVSGTEGNEPTAHGQAEAVFAATGFHGGVIVHVGCGDGRLTAALSCEGRNVVHGLSAEWADVNDARAHVRAEGLYGPVSVIHWPGGSLPYVDCLINLIVVETPDPVAESEMMRVLVPGGVAYVKSGADWTRHVKPAAQDTDEWTHYLYDATGNPVSHDDRVGPPRSLQWTAGPPHTRSHEYTSSVAAVVSANGRVFYLADEGPTSNLQGAAEWHLVARDAYNGTLLWKRPIDQWYTHLAGWTSVPIQLQRRLVAVGDRVYVTLGYHAQVSALDAATGQTLAVYEETHGADEIIWHDDVLIVATKSVTDERLAEFEKLRDWTRRRSGPLHERESGAPLITAFNQMENRVDRAIVALDTQSGAALWQVTGKETSGLKPLSLRACGSRLYFYRGGLLSCRELRSGAVLWSMRCDAPQAASKDAIVCCSQQAVTLLSPEDGSTRWTRPSTLVSVRDVFITKDALWVGGFKPFDTGRQHTGPVWGPYFAVQFDLQTGEIIRELAPENPGHHQRCYASKATDRYILGGRRGTEFIDLESGECLWNSWARGVCRYGVMPANGLLYVPPHSCGCYITAKLTGFNAMAARRGSPGEHAADVSARLEKGPAYGHTGVPGHVEHWSTYRGNSGRSGVVACRVPVDLQVTWQVPLHAQLTAPTVADGKVFVAMTDQHTLLALDASSGETAWSYVTGGRLDSPPTIHNGLVLLGCRDGAIYALRASDGTLAWRYRGARDDRRVSAFGQLESAWPIHGSVLVENDVLYFAAGRSSYLDGGIDLYRLDAQSGQLLSVTNLYSPDPVTDQQPPQYNQNQMPGARSDILVADSDYVYLRDQAFTRQGVQVEQRIPHLFTLTDFLDDSWTHRSHWEFAANSSIATGCSSRDKDLVYGRLLLYDNARFYGYARKNVDWSNQFQDAPYHLFARDRNRSQAVWSQSVPIQVRAMVKAEDTLFVAGPIAEIANRTEPDHGQQDASLLAYSAEDGAELRRYDLTAPPRFDGLAAARGQLFMTLTDGSVVCLSAR